ncbi:MAG: N-6 DNA methylase [Desulfobacterales bacterium]|nr:N-6 DNA methylase [Desulfobacterales bacterium]
MDRKIVEKLAIKSEGDVSKVTLPLLTHLGYKPHEWARDNTLLKILKERFSDEYRSFHLDLNNPDDRPDVAVFTDEVLLERSAFVIEEKSPNGDLKAGLEQARTKYCQVLAPIFVVATDAITIEIYDAYPWRKKYKEFVDNLFRYSSEKGVLFPVENGPFNGLKAIIDKGAVHKRLTNPLEIPIEKALEEFAREPFSRDLFERAISRCQEELRGSGIVRLEDQFYEIMTLMFIKIFEERRFKQNKQYRFTVSELKRNADLTELKVKAGKTYDTYINGTLLSAVKEAYRETGIFAEDDRVGMKKEKNKPPGLKDKNIESIVKELNKGFVDGTPFEVKGEAFQTLLRKVCRGDLGQFFTPKPIVEFMVKLLNPEPGQKILDPCVGTGGFLVSSFNLIKSKISERATNIEDKLRDIDKLKKEWLTGCDIDHKAARTARMNLSLWGDGSRSIFITEDSLVDEDTLKPYSADDPENTGYDLILTNPPFGLKNSSPEVYMKYGISRGSTNKAKSHVIFLKRCLELLKPGGKLGIVISDGLLGGIDRAFVDVKEYVRDEAVIEAIVDLPQKTFTSSKSGEKTSILFLRKKDIGLKKGNVFLAITENAGVDHRGNPCDNQLEPDIVSSFKKFKRAAEKDQLRLISKNPVVLGVRAGDIETTRFYPSYYYLPYFIEGLEENLDKAVELRLLNDLVCEKKTQVNPLRDFPEEIIDYIQISDVPSNLGMIVSFQRALGRDVSVSHAKMPLRAGYVLISRIRPTRGSIAVVPADLDGAIGTDGFIVLEAREDLIFKEVLWLLLRSDAVLKQMYCLQRYSGGYPRVDDISELRLPVPPREIQETIKNSIIERQKRIYEANRITYEANLSLNDALRYNTSVLTETVSTKVASIKLTAEGELRIDYRPPETFSVCDSIKPLEIPGGEELAL